MPHVTTTITPWAGVVDRYRAMVEPRPDGLPRWRVLLSLPAVLLIVGSVLILLGWNGSSSGAYFSQFYRGTDPAVIAGEPRAIRTDEWKVATPLIIAQAEQGFPAVNETFPGGMDAALPYDLPRAEWSVAFRPHLLGYLFLDIDRGTAWRWWVTGLPLIAAAFVFAVTLLPRRPGCSAMLAIGFFASPFFQWWYLSSTFWPVTWALVTMAALRWGVVTRRAWERWMWALPVAYLSIVMAMGIYVPFIVPVVLVSGLYGVGLLIARLRGGDRWPTVLARMAPVLSAGVVASGVMVIWISARQDTIDGFLSTVYPGTRLTPTGSASAESMVRTAASSFSESLVNANGLLGINSSESASFFLIGLWLVPIMVWLVATRSRRGASLPWEPMGLVAALVIIVAFAVVPGWDALAQLLFLDRSTADRTRIGLGLASFALVVVLAAHLDAVSVRPSRRVAWMSALAFLASQATIALAILVVLGRERLLHDAPLWWAIAIGSAVGIVFFARGQPSLGAALYLLVGVGSSLGVNPLYSGVLDLRETAISAEVMRLDAAEPGTWVGVGDSAVTAVLLESGVETYNGTQGAPSTEMWSEIDPDGEFAPVWNRIATIGWTSGAGEPVLSNPAADQIVVTFDACSYFAQKNVDRVLADSELSSPCLVELATTKEGDARLSVYDVRAARDSNGG